MGNMGQNVNEEDLSKFIDRSKSSAIFILSDTSPKDQNEKGVDKLVPGLTGWAQVNGRDELPIPIKVGLDFEYLERQSCWFDIYILWLTFLRVFRGAGVSH